jgi:hypothetical protein
MGTQLDDYNASAALKGRRTTSEIANVIVLARVVADPDQPEDAA